MDRSTQSKHAAAIRLLADHELSPFVSFHEAKPEQKMVALVEAIRVLDAYSWADTTAKDDKKKLPDLEFNLLRWGWAKFLPLALTPLERPEFPLAKSTHGSRSTMCNLLMQLGRGSLLHRAADMVQSLILQAEETATGYALSMVPEAKAQFLDAMEERRYKDLRTNYAKADFINGWKQIHNKGARDFDVQSIGNYFRLDGADDGLDDYIVSDISDRAKRLVRPWQTLKGTMVGYDASPDVDAHFFSLAMRQMRPWMDEAGLHLEANLDGISGVELAHAVWFLTFLHLKHVALVNEASVLFAEVSWSQSLTIWCPLSDLIDSYSLVSGHTAERSELLLRTVMFCASDIPCIEGSTTPYVPLLVDVGNGYVLRPVSSIYTNPLLPLIDLMIRRKPSIRNALELNREAWMREEVAAMFQGWKYQVPTGNFKLRAHGRLLTDIDGVIFDRETGDLGIFQFKWQDFFTNDVRQLRSRAKNFTEQMDAWASAVIEWFTQRSESEVLQTFRLRSPAMRIGRVFLFGMARSRARMERFGYGTTHPNLAICNWPQFARTRYEVGPGGDAIRRIHGALMANRYGELEVRPMPFTLKSADQEIHFTNLMNTVHVGDTDS